MRLLFLTDNFPPETNAPALRSFEHIQEWIKNDHEVTVITCFPNFPKGEVFDGYNNRFIKVERFNGIRVIRVWTYIAANEGFIKRIVDYMSFAVMAFCIGLFVKTDKIMATSPQFFTAVSGWALSFLKRKKFIFEVRDIWPESIYAVGLIEKKFTYKLLEKIEIFLYSRSDLIVVVTDSFRDNLVSRGVNSKKIKIHKNGIIRANFNIVEADANLLNLYPNLINKDVVGYIGTMGSAHALEFILNAASEIALLFPRVHFLLIGEGSEKAKLQKMILSNRLVNVTILDAIPRSELSRYFSLIDVSLVNLRKSDTFKGVIPSKIFEAAAYNKPILIGVDGEARRIVEAYGAGVFYDPENSAAFIKACELVFQQEKYQSYSQGGLRLSKDFDRRKIALELLEDLIQIS